MKYYILFLMVSIFSISSISAFERGGGYSSARYSDRHFVDPNYYYYGAQNGYYGDAAIVDDGGVVIDPNAGSGAGMTDDSDALYQSYLNDFGVTH